MMEHLKIDPTGREQEDIQQLDFQSIVNTLFNCLVHCWLLTDILELVQPPSANKHLVGADRWIGITRDEGKEEQRYMKPLLRFVESSLSSSL